MLATVFSSIIYSNLDAKIQAMEKSKDELTGKINLLWDNHKLADTRSREADLFLGIFTVVEQNSDFFLSQIGQNLRGAILAMMAAADKEIPDDTPDDVIKLETRLLTGNLEAYSALKKRIDVLRLESRKAINAINKERRLEENEIRRLEKNSDLVRLLYIGLNILGLIVVMMKDLPIWKQS